MAGWLEVQTQSPGPDPRRGLKRLGFARCSHVVRHSKDCSVLDLTDRKGMHVVMASRAAPGKSSLYLEPHPQDGRRLGRRHSRQGRGHRTPDYSRDRRRQHRGSYVRPRGESDVLSAIRFTYKKMNFNLKLETADTRN